MELNRRSVFRASLVIALGVFITISSTRLRADTGSCGGVTITLPFTDVMASPFFCQIGAAYFSGLTNGTSATTYNPSDPVPREQIAAFVTRTLDQSLKRGSKRAALDQHWTPTSREGLGLTAVGTGPTLVKSDGADLWVSNSTSGTVSRVRASDSKLLEIWTGAAGGTGVLSAKGLIFVGGSLLGLPGRLYEIDPAQPMGAVTTLPIDLGSTPVGISFDGARIWTANLSGSVSIITLNPLSVSTITTGFSSPYGILFDGANIWVTDNDPGRLLKLDSNGAIIQTIGLPTTAVRFPVFDGTNIWVPHGENVTVVRASTGAVLATLTGNGLHFPTSAAFDGERILVTNFLGDSVSLWKAADLTPLGSVSTGANSGPNGACSDGLNFWVTLNQAGELARF